MGRRCGFCSHIIAHEVFRGAGGIGFRLNLPLGGFNASRADSSEEPCDFYHFEGGKG